MLSEIGKYNIPMMNHILERYEFKFEIPPKNPRGGAAIYVNPDIGSIRSCDNFKIEMTCDCDKCQVESIFIEIDLDDTYTIGCIYRHPNGNISHFTDALKTSLAKVKTKNPIIISGDININLINHDHHLVRDYLDALIELQLIPLITLPTRITDTTATCIDHIYLRPSKKCYTKAIKCGAFFGDISDHLPIFLMIDQIKKPKNERRYVRIYNESNKASFIDDIRNYDWDSLIQINETNSAYSEFISSFIGIF